MSRGSFSASNYLNATTVVTAPPFSISAWFKPTSITSTQCVVQVGNGPTGSNDGYQLFMTATSFLRARSQLTASTGGPNSTTTMNNNLWNHGLGVFTSATSSTIYLNGGGSATANPAVTPGTVASVNFGYHVSTNAPADPFSGLLGEVAIWNATLDANDAIMLASGASPLSIRSSNLVGYWPLDGISSPETDLSGQFNAATITGSPTYGVDSPLIAPLSKEWYDRAINVAAAGFTAKFRRTLSPIGSRVGSRQTHGWGA